MRVALTSFLIPMLWLLSLTGCGMADTSLEQSSRQDDAPPSHTHEISADANFRLLISDDPNAIGDFEELWVTISAVTFVPAAPATADVMVSLEPVRSVNLVELLGDNAISLWEGYLPEGEYSKVFLYVDEVTGWLSDSDEPIIKDSDEPIIKLPSDKLQLDLRFEVYEPAADQLTNFVYDIVVIRAGNSGQYILKPQLNQSGVSQPFKLLEHTRERIREGRPDWAHRPEWAAKPDWAGEGAVPPHNIGPGSDVKPKWAGRHEWSGRPEWVSEDNQVEEDDEE